MERYGEASGLPLRRFGLSDVDDFPDADPPSPATSAPLTGRHPTVQRDSLSI